MDTLHNLTWGEMFENGVQKLLNQEEIRSSLDPCHLEKTPQRFVGAMREYLAGHYVSEDEVNTMLKASFEEKWYDQMLVLLDIPFISHCAHHIAPFFGKIHFGYIPRGKIVGLSKIPRLVEIYSRRLQIQERLTEQLAAKIQEIVAPTGCGIMIEAQHFCVCARGVRAPGVVTITTALKSSFYHEATKQEFLGYCQKSRGGNLL